MPSSSLKVPSIRVDLLPPAAEKIVLTLETIRDDKIRINSSSLDHPLVILADQALEIVAIEKKTGWSRRATVRRRSKGS